jgi:hypothetical protein
MPVSDVPTLSFFSFADVQLLLHITILGFAVCPVSTDLVQSLPSYSQLFNSKLCARGHAVNPMLYDCYSNIDSIAYHLSSKLRTPIFFFATVCQQKTLTISLKFWR